MTKYAATVALLWTIFIIPNAIVIWQDRKAGK
jgi:hypothetical protein